MAKVEYVTCPKCGSYQIEQRPGIEAGGYDVVCLDCVHVLELPDTDAVETGEEAPTRARR